MFVSEFARFALFETLGAVPFQNVQSFVESGVVETDQFFFDELFRDISLDGDIFPPHITVNKRWAVSICQLGAEDESSPDLEVSAKMHRIAFDSKVRRNRLVLKGTNSYVIAARFGVGWHKRLDSDVVVSRRISHD